MDPFFLNPHKYAYVLSISQKYTFLLLPFIVLFTSFNFKYLNEYFSKFRERYILFLSIIPFFLLIPKIKNFLKINLYEITKKIIPFYNGQEYYLLKIEKIFIWMIFLSFLVYIFYIINNVKKRKNDIIFKKFIFLLIFFIVPYFYILSNNYNIINTFRYIISENTLKNQKIVESLKAKNLYHAIHYINNGLPENSKILIHFEKPNNLYLNAWFYTRNNQRLLSGKEIYNINNINSFDKYVLIEESLLQNFSAESWELIGTFNNLSLFEISK